MARTGDPDVFWYDGTRPVSTVRRHAHAARNGLVHDQRRHELRRDGPARSIPRTRRSSTTSLDGGAMDRRAARAESSSAEGPHQLQYQARDKAGNLETGQELQLRHRQDRARRLTLQADRLPNATGWYTVGGHLHPVGHGSRSPARRGLLPAQRRAVAEGRRQPLPSRLAAEGSYRIEYYGQDAAGNRSEQSTVEAHVDATPPATGAGDRRYGRARTAGTSRT